jgi:hypothetical protein
MAFLPRQEVPGAVDPACFPASGSAMILATLYHNFVFSPSETGMAHSLEFVLRALRGTVTVVLLVFSRQVILISMKESPCEKVLGRISEALSSSA